MTDQDGWLVVVLDGRLTASLFLQDQGRHMKGNFNWTSLIIHNGRVGDIEVKL